MATPTIPTPFADLPFAPGSLAPMEAKSAAELPEGAGWQYEPKWDGFRCLVFKSGDAVALQAKSGKALTRFFPEVASFFAGLATPRVVLDGELMIESAGGYSFDALGQRLHPAASRIARLARETPALLAAFDLLVTPRGRDLRAQPLAERRRALEAFAERHAAPGRLLLGPATRDRALALRWLAEGGSTYDGVVAKPCDAPYRAGERAMLKVKRRRTADCVVGGFGYAQGSRDLGSLLLGLYDAEGRLHHVGFTANPPHEPDLLERLEALAGGPGFDADAPGGPSRWARERSTDWTPLRPKLVVEIGFDQVTAARIRHGARFLRWRPDKRPDQCRLDQIESPGAPGGIG